jgi:uncharacterized protein YkwD
MPGQLRSTLALLSCLVALVVAAPAQADPSWAEQRLVERINDARASYGLRQLRFASNLAQGASAWSERLVRRDALRHAKLPAGTGEIIAWGTCDWFRPKRAVRMWLNSPGHRALLLRGGFRLVGTGWTRGSWRSYGCVEMAVARFR